MIKPLIIQQILVDLYYQGVYQFTINQFTHLDIRRQICEQNAEGYSLKINPQFYNLFDAEDDIANQVVTITADGEIDTWFPIYDINEEYKNVDVFGETLSAAIKIRHAQKNKNK